MRMLGVLSLGLILLSSANASIIEVTVDTDKDTYDIGEDVIVYVTAYNPGDEAITLDFGTSMQANYIMDGVYDYSSGNYYLMVCTSVQIAQNDSYTWTFVHKNDALSAYPLSQGTHSITGQVIGYGDSNTMSAIQFEIVPEPASLMLLGLGGLLFRRIQFSGQDRSI